MLKLHLFLKAAVLHVAHVHYVRRTSMYRGKGFAIYRILRNSLKKALLSGGAAKSTSYFIQQLQQCITAVGTTNVYKIVDIFSYH